MGNSHVLFSCGLVGSQIQQRRHRYVVRTTILIQVVLPVWPSNQNIDWWHWLVICCPNTTQSTTQASPQDNYHLAVVESPRSEPSSLAKSIASYIMASLSNSSTSSPVGAPSLSSYLSPRQVDNTKLHTIPVVCNNTICLLYTSPSPRDRQKSRMPSSA